MWHMCWKKCKSDWEEEKNAQDEDVDGVTTFYEQQLKIAHDKVKAVAQKTFNKPIGLVFVEFSDHREAEVYVKVLKFMLA